MKNKTKNGCDGYIRKSLLLAFEGVRTGMLPFPEDTFMGHSRAEQYAINLEEAATHLEEAKRITIRDSADAGAIVKKFSLAEYSQKSAHRHYLKIMEPALHAIALEMDKTYGKGAAHM